MSHFRTGLRWILLGACVLAGCEPAVEQAQPSTVTPSATAASTATLETPTPAPTAAGPLTLTIWFPDELLPQGDDTLSAVLEAEINEYTAVDAEVRIELRRKSSEDVGGIMSTLRAASSVAPGALPDIALMRREDLLIAVEEGLIQPLEGRIASSVIADLYPAALRVGRTDDQLYGLPYLLDLYLYAFRNEGEPPSRNSSFAAVIDRGQTFALPAVHANGIADILWVQYAAAGGTLSDSDSELTRTAVSAVLSFYEQLAQANLIAPGSSDYARPDEYADALASGRILSGIVNTATLRQLADADPPLRYGSVPTSSGEPATLVDGWMWVIVTPSPERQVQVSRFLNWMMDAGRHSSYAQAVMMPPSQRSALRRWQFPGLDTSLLSSLLADSVPVQPTGGVSSQARALQSAWLDVLTGRLSAAEASAAALEP
jgi:ABC-type glycerol-3-phosphate transport system substrate-binding protein